jgi:hypothetical protein
MFENSTVNINALCSSCEDMACCSSECPNQTTIQSNGSISDSGVPRNLFRGGGGGSTNSVEDRENGDLGGDSPLFRGSGGSCNLVQEISFHIVKFS